MTTQKPWLVGAAITLAVLTGARAQTPPAPAVLPAAPPAMALPPGLLMMTPQALGAHGDGQSDDTAALAKALASGHPVWCDGRFRITAPIVTAVPPGGVYAIIGSGRQACQIVLASKTARLEADVAGTAKGDNSSHTTAKIVLRDISFTPTAAITGNPTPKENAAFSGVFAASGDGTSGRVDIRNVAVLPVSRVSWVRYGLYLERSRTSLIDNIRCEGAQAYFYDADSACVYFHGAPAKPADGADIPTGLWISHLAAYNHQFGVKTDGHIEGLIVDDSEIVGGQVGVQVDDSDTTASTLVQASHDEVNVTDAGFNIIGAVRLQIHDDHIFLGTIKDDGQNAFCIGVTGRGNAATLFAQFHDNLCEGWQRVVAGGHRRIGVQFNNLDAMTKERALSQVHDNIFSGVDVGVFLGATVNNVDVGCNQYTQDGKTKTKIVGIEDHNPETTAGYQNFMTCAVAPMATGASPGR